MGAAASHARLTRGRHHAHRREEAALANEALTKHMLLRVWRRFAEQGRHTRAAAALLRDRRESAAVRAVWLAWRQLVLDRRARAAQVARATRHAEAASARRALAAWRQLTLERQARRRDWDMAVAVHARRVTQRAFTALRGLVLARKREGLQLAQAVEADSRRLLRRGLDAWRLRLEQRRQLRCAGLGKPGAASWLATLPLPQHRTDRLVFVAGTEAAFWP